VILEKTYKKVIIATQHNELRAKVHTKKKGQNT